MTPTLRVRLASLLLASIPVVLPGAEALATDAALTAIRAQVADLRQKLGDRAGVPEEPDQVVAIPKQGRWLTPAEARGGFARALPKLEQIRWWRIGLDPTKLTHALREPAAVVSGAAAAARAGLDGAERARALAHDAADFLQWAQAQGGTGVFPFPAARGVKGDRAFAAAEKYFAAAERAGTLDAVIRNGWAIEDAGDGGLQFDNAEAGLAMFELHALTGRAADLASARRAADWAVTRPLVKNWNYNSFSVTLLAKAFAVTGERRYLDTATHKAIVGVIPGQLRDGPRIGRWLDPHNAKPAYHYIMMRALAQLAAVLPADAAARPDVVEALRLGLRARNADLIGPGATNKDKAMEALLLVQEVFAKDAVFLRETHTTEALDALGKLVSEQFRRGGEPLGPRGWGMFLAYAAGR